MRQVRKDELREVRLSQQMLNEPFIPYRNADHLVEEMLTEIDRLEALVWDVHAIVRERIRPFASCACGHWSGIDTGHAAHVQALIDHWPPGGWP